MPVSVIVPNYNHAAYLKQRINSILEQSYEDFEIIILDDCSTDNSRNIIEQYRNNKKVAKIIYNETNSGSTFKQWNKGIKIAKNDLIWIAESDDFADKDLLQNLQLQFDGDPELGIAYCQSNKVNERNEITGSWQSWTEDLNADLFKKRFKLNGKDYISQFLIYRNTIPNASAVLFHKKYYEMVGGADEKTLESGDWLTWIKILTVSNIVYIPQHFNNFRYHDKSVIGRARNNASERYIGRDAIIMRINLHKFLKDRSSGNKDFGIIINKNRNILIEECAKESYFFIEKKSWIKGINILLKTGFNSLYNFVYLFKYLSKKTLHKIKG